MQNEYLFLCRENFHDISELMDFVTKNQNEIDKISMQQKDIYTRICKEKDTCRMDEDVGISQLLDMDIPEDPNTVKQREHENQISVEERHIVDAKFYKNFLEQSQKKTDTFRKKEEEYQAIYDSLMLEDKLVSDEGDYLSDGLKEEDTLEDAIYQNSAEINSLESVIEETVAIALDENVADA